MNFWTWVILAVIVLAVALGVKKIISDKKSGKCSGCGGNCQSCRQNKNRDKL